MKVIKTLIAAVMTAALLTSVSFAGDQSCCDKAKAEGKDCAHKCCVDAKKEGKVCEKCNPKKDEKKA